MSALKGFHSVVSSFNRRIGPPTGVIIDDLRSPVSHRFDAGGYCPGSTVNP